MRTTGRFGALAGALLAGIAPEPLIALADTATEMHAVKHRFTDGRKALIGVDC